MMKIIVRAAHFIARPCFVRGLVLHALWRARGCLSKDSVMLQAHYALLREDALYGDKKEVTVCENIFDPIYPQCTNEDRMILRDCLEKGGVLREFRSEVTLNVEPCMNVGALKSLLKAKPWIPKENLVLVGLRMLEDDSSIVGARPLEDDSSTLHDCGIEGEDILLACMSGSFPFTVVDVDQEPNMEFVIPISSCFETVGELKSRIYQKMGKAPDDQHIYYQNRIISTIDSTPLVAHGIARPYLNMPESSKTIEMLPQSIFLGLMELNYQHNR